MADLRHRLNVACKRVSLAGSAAARGAAVLISSPFARPEEDPQRTRCDKLSPIWVDSNALKDL